MSDWDKMWEKPFDHSQEPKMTHEEILERYSTPRLRRNELSRSAKKDHLDRIMPKELREGIPKILDEIYPVAEEPPTEESK